MRNRYLSYIVVVTAAAAIASACAKSEVDKPHISFAPVASKPTKAIISGTDYPVGESFKVSAYHNGSSAYFVDLTASNIAPHRWETSSDQYWPLEGSLTFNAYSPASADATIDASGISAEDYTIRTAEQMTTDFCYASYTEDECSSRSDDEVPLVFSHALTQVVIRAKAAANYNTASTTISLATTSITLSGIYSVGDFSSADGWENLESEQSYSLSGISTPLTYDENDQPEIKEICSYLFIPQELGANAALNVGYSVVQTVNSTPYSLTNPPVTIPLGNTVTEWEPGKKYVYTLNIGINNVITFTVTAVGWQTENDNIIVEEN